MIDIRHVHPDTLHDVWHEIAEEIDHCRAQDSDDVWAEDIYASLRYAQSHLYRAYNHGEAVGWFIANEYTDPWSKEKRLHIWLTHFRNDADAVAMSVAHLESMAQQIGAKRLTFRANRFSFERLMKRHGFRLATIELIKDIEHG